MAAEAARAAAETAETNAETAETNAETAQTAAESARDTAQDHKTDAETAKTGSESARDTAETHKDDAETAQTAAESARDTASNHRDDAEKLAIHAEDSQFQLTDNTYGYSALHYNAKAQAAKTAAETAQTAAETANNSFQALYRTGTSNPTDSLDAGDLFYRTDTGSLLIYSGSAWEAGVTAGSGFVAQVGGAMTGDLQMNNADIIFEGSTADANETTLTVTDPTADRTVTIPDKTGTVVQWPLTVRQASCCRPMAPATTASSPSQPTYLVIATRRSQAMDVGTHDIVSSSNNDISLLPNGTGKVIADGNGSTGGISLTDGLMEMRTGTSCPAQIDLYCEVSNAHKVSIKVTGTRRLQRQRELHPTGWSNGTNGQFLQTDGSGNLSYATVNTACRTIRLPQLMWRSFH